MAIRPIAPWEGVSALRAVEWARKGKASEHSTRAVEEAADRQRREKRRKREERSHRIGVRELDGLSECVAETIYDAPPPRKKRSGSNKHAKWRSTLAGRNAFPRVRGVLGGDKRAAEHCLAAAWRYATMNDVPVTEGFLVEYARYTLWVKRENPLPSLRASEREKVALRASGVI